MKRFLSNVLAISMFLFLSVVALNAYSIQNATDTKIIAHQGDGFVILKNTLKIELNPGENFNCSWKDSTCNKSMDPNAWVRFTVASTKKRICRNFQIRANGVLLVSGKNGDYQCLALAPIKPIPGPNDRIE